MTGVQIAQRAKDQIAQLTGLRPDTVAGLNRTDQGWRVTIVLIEQKSIPDSRDVLGAYEALLDEAGELVSYERTRRYLRGQV